MFCAIQSCIGKLNQLSLEAGIFPLDRDTGADGDLLHRQGRVGFLAPCDGLALSATQRT